MVAIENLIARNKLKEKESSIKNEELSTPE
jgi:hypothetical protein